MPEEKTFEMCDPILKQKVTSSSQRAGETTELCVSHLRSKCCTSGDPCEAGGKLLL